MKTKVNDVPAADTFTNYLPKKKYKTVKIKHKLRGENKYLSIKLQIYLLSVNHVTDFHFMFIKISLKTEKQSSSSQQQK